MEPKAKTEAETKPAARNINKPCYVIFIVAGIYFLIVKDLSQAVTFWGIALVFDPFNITMPFTKRPFYQQAWLYIHLAITLALFVLMLLEK